MLSGYISAFTFVTGAPPALTLEALPVDGVGGREEEEGMGAAGDVHVVFFVAALW